jgi:uncharacterized membrane protein
MKGMNFLQLSNATVTEAIQEYFDRRTVYGYAKDKVHSTSWNTTTRMLDVTMIEQEQKVEPRA